MKIGSGWIAVIATISLLLGAVFVGRYVSSSLELAHVQAATTRAESVNDAIREFRTLYTSEVVQRLGEQGITVSHDYAKNDKDIPLPATMTKMIGEHLAEHRNGSEVRLYSNFPFPWQVNGGPRNAIEREALVQLGMDPSEPYIGIDETGGKRILYYASADIMRASCVSCHNTHPDSPKTDWKIGDVRGVLGVSIDLNAENLSSSGAANGLARTLLLVTIIGGVIVALLILAITIWSRKENKQLQLALHDVANQKRALDEHAIVSITDVDGVITYVNEKFVEISGYSYEELVGQSQQVIINKYQDREAVERQLEILSSKRVWVGEEKNYTKDGDSYWAVSTVVPFADESGEVTQYVTIRTDITDRKRSESELIDLIQDLEYAREVAEAADLSKSNFLANMSHEIRTPMTAILGYAETLSENVESQEHVEAAEVIQRNGEHLLAIINDILDLSKVEAGKLSVESIPFNLCELISDIASLVGSNARAKGLGFVVDYIGDVPETIQSDPTRLRQILINLVGNAIKFTKKGEVRITTQLVRDGDNASLAFEVHDTGIGMTDEQIKSLFRPFVQADNSTTRKFGGTGLGLTISKRFAELLGGSIIVSKSEMDVGTVFRFTLPVGLFEELSLTQSEGIDELIHAPREKEKRFADLTGLRVLVAEDGPDNQRLISFFLKKAGAQVVIAENGKLAYDAAMESRDEGGEFDCILMDMQMPIMSGFESTSALRAGGYCGTIIALTASAMDGDRERCILAGCDDFSVKPIDRGALIAQIYFHSRSSSDAA